MPRTVASYSGQVLTPYDPNVPAPCFPVNLKPSTTYAAGTWLGRITTAASDVQTLTITGTPTGGTFTLTGTNPITGEAFATGTIAYNAAATVVAAAVQTAIGQGVTVAGTGGALPGTPVVLTFAGSVASRPVAILTLSITGLTGGTPGGAVVHTTVGVTAGTFGTYVDANSDGTGVAKCLLKYACVTDGSGNVTYGGQVAGVDAIGNELTAPAYFGGVFASEDTTGLDAAALTDVTGRLLWGTTTTGVFQF